MVLYVFALDGSLVYGPDIRDAFPQELVERVLTLHPGAAYVHQGEAVPPPVIPVWEGGQVVGIEPDPDWTPPEPAPDPVQVRLEALEQAVARQEQAVAANLLASPHDRRWLAQKERAKLFGIAWLKAHPEASMEELAVAVETDLAEQFPGQPIVVSAGIILSYAAEANARGYIPDSSFTSL
ncbi:MAG: hypothetical protein V1797_09640, partial [Pseudomonadota bacterium]